MRKITMDNKQEKPDRKQDLQNPKEENSDTKSSKEIGGPKGPEPTRYGDWERRGRCIDFWLSCYSFQLQSISSQGSKYIMYQTEE